MCATGECSDCEGLRELDDVPPVLPSGWVGRPKAPAPRPCPRCRKPMALDLIRIVFICGECGTETAAPP